MDKHYLSYFLWWPYFTFILFFPPFSGIRFTGFGLLMDGNWVSDL